MTSFVSDDLGPTRFFSVFLGTLAAAALLLALIGIYGALSLSVGQRTREIAVRAALGAERMSIFKLVMKESLLVVLVAEVIGMAGAMILGRFLSTLLFGVTPADPMTFCGGWPGVGRDRFCRELRTDSQRYGIGPRVYFTR
ncbi:MAG TPA: FtsX-like permease family protein [Candidatus Acidoferrum sp.]